MIRGRSANERRYECRDCSRRVTPTSYRARCPACGGALQNVAVSRE